MFALRHLDQYIESDENFGDIAPYDTDPARFLNLLRGATYICTDSFHGSIFAIIHHKPFLTFNRYDESSKHSKNSRIDTLCNNLSLQDRRFTSTDRLYEQLCQHINYNNVEHTLGKLKEEANAYLDKAFNNLNS